MASFDARHRRIIRLWPICAVVVVAAACGGGGHKTATGLFDNQNQASISCMDHQIQQPGSLYTGGEHADTAHVLEMMQYFTSFGDKPYCDGKAASATDATWAKLYVSLGGSSSKVKTALGQP